MKFNDAISGLFLAVLALAVIAYSRTLPAMPGQFVGPGLFPTVIGAGMLLGSALLIVKGLQARASRPWVALADWVASPRPVLHLALIVAVILAYILFSEQIGFLPLSVAVLAALFAVGGVRWWVNAAAAVAGTLLVYFLFLRLLRVPLPRGLLDFLPF
ncbi:MAG: tripartite tricarboxylate transporter TctB family protein [Rhodospirillales bacterium]